MTTLEQPQQPPPSNTPQLQVVDLINFRLFMQVMTKREAILPSEMEAFGIMYKNLNEFLNFTVPDAPTYERPETLKSSDETTVGTAPSPTPPPSSTPSVESDGSGKPANVITI
jgi:hypothetical protein